MLVETKARVGVFAIALGAYLPQFPTLVPEFEQQYAAFKKTIPDTVEAREQAYVPYSDFMVGAALRAEDGRIFTGCNVENAAFTPTSCAERTALFRAVSEGVTRFTDIAVVGSRRGEVNKQITSPCGVCRQALFEFGGPELNVIMAKTPDDFIERSMDELLPFGFGPSNVAGNKAVEE